MIYADLVSRLARSFNTTIIFQSQLPPLDEYAKFISCSRLQEARCQQHADESRAAIELNKPGHRDLMAIAFIK